MAYVLIIADLPDKVVIFLSRWVRRVVIQRVGFLFISTFTTSSENFFYYINAFFTSMYLQKMLRFVLFWFLAVEIRGVDAEEVVPLDSDDSDDMEPISTERNRRRFSISMKHAAMLAANAAAARAVANDIQKTDIARSTRNVAWGKSTSVYAAALLKAARHATETRLRRKERCVHKCQHWKYYIRKHACLIGCKFS